MHIYLGRQPVFDRHLSVAGYELLFRSSMDNFCDATDDFSSSAQVMVNAVTGIGLDRLLGHKPAFISFDRSLLLEDWTALFPPDKIVIKILDTVQPDREIRAACHKLRHEGYTLALNYRPDEGRTEAFAPFVDMLKVDFGQTPFSDQEMLIRRYRKLKLKMIAGKVETEAEFQTALQLGYDYFQGFFFAKPTVLRATSVPACRMNCMRLAEQMQRDEMDVAAIEDVIARDISLSHLLLKYLNSAAFHWANRVDSVRHALILLGADETRRWVWMASLSGLAGNRPSALMAQVLMRGRFCEVIAHSSGLPMGDADPFLMGMFSLLDAILQRPLQGILDELNIGQRIRNALLGTGPDAGDSLAPILQIVKCYEAGDWQGVESAGRLIGVSASVLSACYIESLSWVDAVCPQATQRVSSSTPLIPSRTRGPSHSGSQLLPV